MLDARSPLVALLLAVSVAAAAGCSRPDGVSPPVAAESPASSSPDTTSSAGSDLSSATPSGPPSAGSSGASAAPVIPDPLTPTDLVTDLTSPWGIDAFDDGTFLLSERDTGRILRTTAGGGVRELGSVDATTTAEGGLLGVALADDESSVVAYYSTAADNRVVRMPLSGDRLGDERVLLDGIPTGTNHNGGQVRFGPDGFLYVSTGDANQGAAAQDRASLGGKILRMTADGDPAPGNPWGTVVYSMGHRNVQGLAWDDEGRLWASEFGQNHWDELNLIEAGGNYGWPTVEGEAGRSGMIDPVRVWTPADASPSGLAYWRGSLWMAGLRGQRLWQIPVSASGDTDSPVAHWAGTYGRLRAVVSGGDAGPLVVGTSNTDRRGNPRSDDDRLLKVG